MTQEITEMCPYCGEESTIKWDIESQGYQIFCPVCGEAMMLCSMCDRAPCDWKEGVGCKHSDERYRKGRWISVKERLPERGERIIVCTEHGFRCETIMKQSGRYFRYGIENEEIFGQKIVAWMPLPEPYYPERNDK